MCLTMVPRCVESFRRDPITSRYCLVCEYITPYTIKFATKQPSLVNKRFFLNPVNILTMFDATYHLDKSSVAFTSPKILDDGAMANPEKKTDHRSRDPYT